MFRAAERLSILSDLQSKESFGGLIGVKYENFLKKNTSEFYLFFWFLSTGMFYW